MLKLNCIRHLHPLDAFSRLLVGPKCISVGALPEPRWYSDPQTRGEQFAVSCPRTPSPLSISASGVTPKRHGFRDQSELLQRVLFHWKGSKTLQYENATDGSCYNNLSLSVSSSTPTNIFVSSANFNPCTCTGADNSKQRTENTPKAKNKQKINKLTLGKNTKQNTQSP